MRPTNNETGAARTAVPGRLRPDPQRAAAAARLAGASAGPDAVRRRIAEAARRAEREGSEPGVTRLRAPRPGRPAPARDAGGRRSNSPTEASGRMTARRAPDPGPDPARVAARRRTRTGTAADGDRSRSGSRPARAIANPAGMAAAAGLAAAEPQPAREEQPRPRHLKVVPPGTLSAAQRRRRARALLIATIGAATAIALSLVYLHVVLAQRQFRIDQLNSNLAKAQTSYQNLRLQVAQLGSPQQIISTAEGQLGMQQPNKVVYLSPPASATNPGAGNPATNPAAGTGAAGTRSSARSGASGPAGNVLAPSQAPAGDADWPTIKSQLAGTP